MKISNYLFSVVDTIGTIVANTSASPQQADIFADDSQRICHIVKQDESAGANGEARNAKIISEVFLTRLLSTKVGFYNVYNLIKLSHKHFTYVTYSDI